MKTAYSIVVIFFCLLAFSSCIRTWTCKCEGGISGTYSGVAIKIPADTSFTMENTKRKDANNTCFNYRDKKHRELEAEVAANAQGNNLSVDFDCFTKN